VIHPLLKHRSIKSPVKTVGRSKEKQAVEVHRLAKNEVKKKPQSALTGHARNPVKTQWGILIEPKFRFRVPSGSIETLLAFAGDKKTVSIKKLSKNSLLKVGYKRFQRFHRL
jgi:hypothetical protein